MSRRNRPAPRPNLPDARFNSILVQMLVNRMMYGGKKSTAQHVLYEAMDMVGDRAKREPLAVLEQAIYNVAPAVEVKPRRVGGSTYQVPIDVTKERGESLAMRWLLQFARGAKGKSMAERFAAVVLDAANGQGAAIKKKEETHRMAEANRAFAHYRW